jgi:chromosome segregation protein
MKRLKQVHVVQFSFWDYETFLIEDQCTAIIGANGAGKTTLIDSIQIGLVGASASHLHFNAQSVQKDERLLRDYALGAMRSGEGASPGKIIARKREEALSYITLVFEGEGESDVVSAGVCIHSLASEREHRIVGLYVLPGVRLELEDHLESLGGEGRAPIDWSQFENLVQLKSRTAGIRPTISTRPEVYQAELLHNIQDPARPISRAQFLRSLKHSINLKHVESVNDFLRKYLVESTAIEKQGTLAHIRLMRSLAKSIDDVKLEIAQLQTIERGFEQLKKWFRQKANAIAVRLDLQAEAADQSIVDIGAAIEDLDERIRVDTRELESAKECADAKDKEIAELIRIEAIDPELVRAMQADKLNALTKQNFESSKRSVVKVETKLRHALQGATAELERQRHSVADDARTLLANVEAKAATGLIASPTLVAEIIARLKEHKVLIHQYWDVARNAAEDAKTAFDNANARAAAARNGVQYDPKGNVGTAIGLFHTAGIQCTTVASLVEMTDVDWQGAVEAFLGRNREALVVEPGREREAVRLLRTAAAPLYGVTVVQPKHLENDLERRYDAFSVANLICGNHPVAVAYLRRMLGSLRQVNSERELEEYPRALTSDGMLSANGGTTRLERLKPGAWLIGVRISADELRKLDDEVGAASEAMTKANDIRNKLRAIVEDIDAALAAGMLDEYKEAVELMNSSFLSMSTALDNSASKKMKEMAQRLEAARAARGTALSDVERLSAAIAGNKEKRADKKRALESAKLQLIELAKRTEEARADLEYDAELSVSFYDECQKLAAQGSGAEGLQYLSNLEQQAERKIASLEPQARADFIRYVNDKTISLRDEMNDWRLSLQWTSAQRNRLVNSTLTDYEEQAARARQAAERAFQADIKFKMREAIRRVQQEIRDLNSILDTCPEFTGGERYSFVADTAAEHKQIFELITSDLDSGQLSISDGEESSPAQATIVKLLEACETGAMKGCNPLEDYRLLFNFDLKISVNGTEVDRLSKRMGVASNGEHRVPFYVIAGASLAAAYRIKTGGKHRGAGVMLIDEAFYGMDAQNSFVTAEFLKSLGLQLVLAGPDTDVGKLIPVLDSYYDIFRPGNGPHAHFEHIVIKAPAKRLLQSDIPEMHPQLIEQKIIELGERS